MLITPHAHELDALIAEFWPVALDLTHSTYPTYTDGIKTQADFAKTVHCAASENWGEVLIHLRNGEVNGLLVADVTDDMYVSLHVCLTHAHQTECLGETLAYLRQKHAGKTLWLGFALECWPSQKKMALRCWTTPSTGISTSRPGNRQRRSVPCSG